MTENYPKLAHSWQSSFHQSSSKKVETFQVADLELKNGNYSSYELRHAQNVPSFVNKQMVITVITTIFHFESAMNLLKIFCNLKTNFI